MSTPGTNERPLRVAVVGAGPAGFYTVEALLKHDDVRVDVDLIERLPAPYGLLRYGVAPDHPKIKAVSAAYDRLAEDSRVRFLGNVAVGVGDRGHLEIDDLLACYDQVVVATGCETDRRMGIPGEDLAGSHCATSFVAWYNGHPDYVSLPVRLDTERAVVVGVGDVAMDLARMLLQDPARLAATDIAGYALRTLEESRIREVVVLARRGPAEAAFAAKELEDIGHLPDLAIDIDADLVERALAEVDPHDTHEKHKLEVLAGLAARADDGAPRRLVLRFLASPAEILGEAERVRALRIEHNELVRGPGGDVRARGSGRFETLETGVVLRSIGYRGVPLPGLPFDEARGLVPNREGRVVQPASAGDAAGAPTMDRLYVAGWIKRGATGVVGTNKGDAAATVVRMLEDLPALEPREASTVSRQAIDARLEQRGLRAVSWQDWKRIDAAEKKRGKVLGKVRDKFTSIDEMLSAADGRDG